MTFYNLPDTEVTLEYDKDEKLIKISKLPGGFMIGTDPDIPEQVFVGWK